MVLPNSVCLKPRAHVIRKAAAAGIMNGEAFPNVGVRRELGDRRQTLAEAAAPVGAEGYDLPAGEVILLQEGCDRHRDRGPPVGIAQQNDVVIVHVVDVLRDLRSRLIVLVALGFHQHGVVIAGIGLGERDLKQIRAGLPLNLGCDAASIAAPGEERALFKA